MSSLLTNLSAYWKLDESSGAPQDSSGAGKHMTNVGTMPFGSAKINNGVLPDGTNRMVALQGDALGFTSSSQSMSWNFWVKASSWTTYVCQITTTAGAGLNTLVYGASGAAKYYIGGNEITSSSLSTGVWYMFTLVKTGTTYEFFVNTTSQGTITNGSQTASSNTALALGCNTNDGGVTVTGSPMGSTSGLDEAGVWSKALSSAEITALYNSGAGLSYPFSSFTPSPDNRMYFM